jgi:hypothetical protein
MIIDIEDELFYKIKELMQNRSKSIYEQLEQIKPLDTIPKDTLQEARDTKTLRIKGNIKKAIIELLQAKRNPTKYQIHKSTNIAYVTLNKYYDDILDEVQNARDEH